MTYDNEITEYKSQLLRAIVKVLNERIAPRLQLKVEQEMLSFVQMTLEYLASDLDVVPLILPDIRQRYLDATAALLATLPTEAAKALQGELTVVGSECVQSPYMEIFGLRGLAARAVRRASDDNINTQDALKNIGQLDREYVVRYTAGSRPVFETQSAAQEQAPTADASFTPETLSRYLREKLNRSPALEVTTISVVPGGRSKRTTLVSLKNTSELPAEVIIRQDMILKYAGQSIVNEVAPLRLLGSLGLAVPKPLLIEIERTEFGGPFFLTHRFAGGAPMDFFGDGKLSHGSVAEVARTLGTLHGLPPHAVGLVGETEHPRILVQRRIEEYWDIWRRNTVQNSALIDYAYAWARRVAGGEYEGETVSVHGDFGPYNWLVDGEKLTAILDWEFLHQGDAGEDLGCVKPYAETAMPWAEFMQIYRDAGGASISPERVALGQLMHWLKGTILVATSARNFVEGGTKDFVKGTNSFTGLRRIEMKIADIFGEF